MSKVRFQNCRASAFPLTKSKLLVALLVRVSFKTFSQNKLCKDQSFTQNQKCLLTVPNIRTAAYVELTMGHGCKKNGMSWTCMTLANRVIETYDRRSNVVHSDVETLLCSTGPTVVKGIRSGDRFRTDAD